MLSMGLWIPPINFWMPETIFMKLRMYVYHGNWAHLNGILHKSFPSLCVSLLSLLCNGLVKSIPPFGARQRFGIHVRMEMIACNRRIVGHVIFYAVRVLSKESLWVCLCIPLSLLGNNSVQTFPRQQRIVGGFAFYAVRVTWKGNRWLILHRSFS
jgi:hypothetical protein